MRLRTLLRPVLATAFVAPIGAQAAVYCVGPVIPCGGTPMATISSAIDVTDLNAGPDEI